MENEPKPVVKRPKTEKQKEAWLKCQQARAKNLKKKKEEKSHQRDEKFVINEVNEVIGQLVWTSKRSFNISDRSGLFRD